jgi:glycosyltransferase 2 family protein
MNSNKQQKRSNKWFLFISRLGISFLLLTLLFRKIDISLFSEVLRNANLSIFLVCFFFYIFLYIPLAYRWKLLLIVIGIKVPIIRLFKTYLIGTFFNRFLPTTIGGDLARGFDLYRSTQMGREITVSIFIERFLGFTSLMIIAVSALCISYTSLRDLHLAWLVLGVAIVYFFVLLVLFLPTITINYDQILKKLTLYRIGDKLNVIPRAITLYRTSPSVLIKTILLSLILQSLTIFIYYILSNALHLSIPLMYMFLFFPIINMVSMIPISLGGLGLREGMTIYLFQKIGVESAHAMGLSIAWYCIIILSGILGGIVFTIQNMNHSAPSSPHV